MTRPTHTVNEQIRNAYCPNCSTRTVQERPDPNGEEWRCYGCGMYLEIPTPEKNGTAERDRA